MVITKSIHLETKGETEIIDITDDVRESLSETGLKNGTVTVFNPGSTGGVTTIELEPGAIQDLKDALEKVAPRKGQYAHNTKWDDMNGYAHVRSSLLGPGITVPFSNGKLITGTWQQIIFIDFDNRPRSRDIVLQFIGEK